MSDGKIIATNWHTVRIHPNHDNPSDIVNDFKNYCETNSIENFILSYEEDASRPHYHALFESPKTQFKLKQSFKDNFPNLKGNKHFAFTKIVDEEGYKGYVCKGGDFKLHSVNYTVENLNDYKEAYLAEKGEQAVKKSKQKQMKKKHKEQLEDHFKNMIDEIKKHNIIKKQDFKLILKDFILANNVINFNRNFIEKYYRIFLKQMDENLYEEYIFKQIENFTEYL